MSENFLLLGEKFGEPLQGIKHFEDETCHPKLVIKTVRINKQ
jgi:hypothetical protein